MPEFLLPIAFFVQIFSGPSWILLKMTHLWVKSLKTFGYAARYAEVPKQKTKKPRSLVVPLTKNLCERSTSLGPHLPRSFALVPPEVGESPLQSHHPGPPRSHPGCTTSFTVPKHRVCVCVSTPVPKGSNVSKQGGREDLQGSAQRSSLQDPRKRKLITSVYLLILSQAVTLLFHGLIHGSS